MKVISNFLCNENSPINDMADPIVSLIVMIRM